MEKVRRPSFLNVNLPHTAVYWTAGEQKHVHGHYRNLVDVVVITYHRTTQFL